MSEWRPCRVRKFEAPLDGMSPEIRDQVTSRFGPYLFAIDKGLRRRLGSQVNDIRYFEYLNKFIFESFTIIKLIFF